MGIIKKLDPIIIDRIAAGEVIERPASVVKELIENSIDAESTKIEIYTWNAGIKKIIIQDNGIGIQKEDLPLTIEKHATSKIHNLKDIEKILSFGFRGEALSSIASVSLLEIQTKHKEEQIGNQLLSRGGQIISIKPIACNTGTKVIVEDLFYTTPARKKYLKNEITENRYILKEIIKYAISKPKIEFIYYRDDKLIFHLPITSFEKLTERINLLFEKNFSELLIPVYFKKEDVVIKGWIGKPRVERTITDRQFIFFNGRPVEIQNIKYIIKNSYGELLSEYAKPIFFLFYEVPPEKIDVNVHPTKKEIRILEESVIYDLTIQTIKKSLLPNTPIELTTRELKKYQPEPGQTQNYSKPQKNSEFLYPIEEIFDKQTLLYSLQENTINPDIENNIINKNNLSVNIMLQKENNNINKEFLPIKHLGVIFGTYIIALGDEDLYLIDQHTAHERINYEKKKKELEKNIWQKQLLLHPIVLQLTQEEYDLFKENKKVLTTYGFGFDEFSNNSIVIREIPDYLEMGNEKKIFIKVIQMLSKGYNQIQLYEEYVAMKACKASIKKNDIIAPEIISKILLDLSKCQEPSRCPHGRPTMLKISRSTLDYLFYRTGF